MTFKKWKARKLKEKRVSKNRIRRRNGGYKKAISVLMIMLITLIAIVFLIKTLIPTAVTFAKFIYQTSRSYLLGTQKFYFKGDKLGLSARPAHFEANNWSGADPYRITVRMNSTKNSIVKADMDIDYNIFITYSVFNSDGVEFTNPKQLVALTVEDKVITTSTSTLNGIEKDTYATNGTIYVASDNQDHFSFNLVLLSYIDDNTGEVVSLETGDYIVVDVVAQSTSPYKETLEGDFKISIGKLGMSFSIDDKRNNPYLNLILTNTLDSYKVDADILDGDNNVIYATGRTLSIDEFLALSDSDRAKCHSMVVTLSFDPNVVVLDTTSDAYVTKAEALGNTINENIIGHGNANVTIGNTTNTYLYVNKLQVGVNAEESKVIRFYKIDPSQDYTYEAGDISKTPIITVDFDEEA